MQALFADLDRAWNGDDVASEHAKLFVDFIAANKHRCTTDVETLFGCCRLLFSCPSTLHHDTPLTLRQLTTSFAEYMHETFPKIAVKPDDVNHDRFLVSFENAYAFLKTANVLMRTILKTTYCARKSPSAEIWYHDAQRAVKPTVCFSQWLYTLRQWQSWQLRCDAKSKAWMRPQSIDAMIQQSCVEEHVEKKHVDQKQMSIESRLQHEFASLLAGQTSLFAWYDSAAQQAYSLFGRLSKHQMKLAKDAQAMALLDYLSTHDLSELNMQTNNFVIEEQCRFCIVFSNNTFNILSWTQRPTSCKLYFAK